MDQQSLDLLNTLHPKLRDKAIALWTKAQAAMPANVRIIVTNALRTFAQSDVDYAKGRSVSGVIITNAKAGQSYHNYGLAFDFEMITNGHEDWVVGPLWKVIVKIFEDAGWTWGGHFPNLDDDDHFENRLGHYWKDLLAKYQAGDFIPGTQYVNI